MWVWNSAFETKPNLWLIQVVFRLCLAQTLVEAAADNFVQNLSGLSQLLGGGMQNLLKHLVYRIDQDQSH